MEQWKIKDNFVEFDEVSHTYIVDGMIIPSVTQFIKQVTHDDYTFVRPDILQRASELGTAMHKSIEVYEKLGITANTPEFHNYLFLKNHYEFEVEKSESPILIYDNDEPILAGRLDQIIKIGGEYAINDFKRIANINKSKVALQLNLYALGVEQSYNIDCTKLYCTQLREQKRKFIELPLNREYTIGEITKWKTLHKQN